MASTAMELVSEAIPSSAAPSTNLFDGELFGDELIDIYSTAIGDATFTIPSNELQQHPTSAAATQRLAAAKLPTTSHPGNPEETSTITADISLDTGDSLGAFKHSTSFDDLAATLLAPTPTKSFPDLATNNTVVNANKMDISTKRVVGEAPANIPIHMKTESDPAVSVWHANHPGEAASVKNSTQASSEVTTKNQSNGGVRLNVTPNPLSVNVPARHVPVPTLQIARVVSAQIERAAIVTPHECGLIEGTTTLPEKSSTVSITAAVQIPALTAITNTSALTQPNTATEAAFESVAKAAVSNLIRNSARDVPAQNIGGKVDTSTAHIRALTGNNWVEAARSSVAGFSEIAATDAAAKVNNNRGKKRRQNLTPDECVRQKNRDRNREHARNTRLRKKAYVEELKRTLTELVAQKESEEAKKGMAAQRELDQREVRFRVIEEFLRLRSRNESSFGRWAAILEDEFKLTLPVTRYRKMVHESGKNNMNQEDSGISIPSQIEQVLLGVPEVMADTRNFASFLLESTGNLLLGTTLPAVGFMYHCDRKNLLMDGSYAVLHWTATSVGAVKHGASRAELSLRGCLRGAFNPASNKLLSVVMTFDTGLISPQLKHNFFVAPPRDDDNLLPELSGYPCDQITAAQDASRRADAILDSLQILPSMVPSAASVTSSDKSE